MNLKFINVVVNDVKIAVRDGTTILNACSLVGVEVSRFCYHEGLAIAGNCRMCLVEIEKAPKPVASCAMPVSEGMVIKTNTDLVKKAREGVMEMLLVNHPLDCPICDQAGECDLQDEALNFGSDRGRYNYGKRVLEDKEDNGPLIKTIMTRCIHCTRCIRFAEDIAGVPVYGTTGRGEQTQVGTYIKDLLTSELSGNVIDLCPVGALTSKPYQFTARPWELKSTETVDVMDATCSPVRIDSKGDRILRVLPREIGEDKAFFNFITDKTRFAYDGYNTQRLQEPLIKTVASSESRSGNDFYSSFERVTWPTALHYIKDKLDNLDIYQLDIITGPTVDLETLIMLNYFQQGFNLSKLVNSPQQPEWIKNPAIYYPGLSYLFNSTQPSNKMLSDVEGADVCLIIGSDLRKESPLLNAFIGRSVLRGTLKVATLGSWSSLPQTFPILHLDNNLEYFITALKTSLSRTKNNTTPAANSQDSSDGSAKSTLLAFISLFLQAKKPLILVADHVFLRPDAQILCNILALLIAHSNVISSSWVGYNVIHANLASIASKFVGVSGGLRDSLESGFSNPEPQTAVNLRSTSNSSVGTSLKVSTSSSAVLQTPHYTKVLFLVGADDFDTDFINNVLLDPKVFIIYQGHHADFGASISDIVLPGSLHTEKNSSFINYKGVVRKTIPVSQPTVLAKKDWEIIAAISQIANIPFVPTSHDILLNDIQSLSHADLAQTDSLLSAYKKFARSDSQTIESSHRTLLIGLLLTFTLVQNSKHFIPLHGSFTPFIPSPLKTFAETPKTAPSFYASLQRKLPFKSTISDYFLTDPISRASALMAQCSQVFNKAAARSL